MRKSNNLFLFFFLLAWPALTQTIWEGPKITFTKPNNADFTIEENQDRITDNVWITRGTTMGIYNIKIENGYTTNSSPADTEWAFGTTASISSLAFDDWQTTVNSNPPGMVGQDMVLHLISEDIYIDLRFLSWSVGTAGGGFSYERSTDLPSATVSDESFSGRITLFPNPGPPGKKNAVFDSRRSGAMQVSMYSLSGKLCFNKTLPVQPGRNNWTLDLSGYDCGIYLLQFRQGYKAATRKIVLN
ncbi:MAG: T9SS type A sorting domain-containing protein [Phaeodactylibacter sp.]|nr:T9SS type A sorting domain-containing protein [Phaeodactylibacter sp.]